MSESPPTSEQQDAAQSQSPGFVTYMRGRLVRLLLFLVVIGGLGGAAFMQFYAIPRAAGEDFAAAFLALDSNAAEDQLCDAGNLGDVRRGLASAGDEVIGLIANTLPVPLPDSVRRQAANLLRVDGTYNPFTSEYRFRMVAGGDLNVAGFNMDAGFETPQVEVNIRRDLFSACVQPG